MNLLLDTHVAIWAVADSARLPEHVSQVIADPNHVVYYSVVSILEVAIKHHLHPDVLALSEQDFSDLCARAGFSLLPMEPGHIYGMSALQRKRGAPVHKDPFDRLLISQAKTEELVFVTHDRMFRAYRDVEIRLF